MRAKTGEAQKEIKGVGGAAAGAAQSMGVAAGAALALGAAMIKLSQHVADMRNELLDASTRSGIAADTLNGLRLAAEGSGQKFTELRGALDGLPKRLADTADGTGDALKAFNKLDVVVTNASGGLRDADDVFKEFITKLQEVESPTERAALATQAFGEAGGKLNQALGDSKLDDFVELANRYGVDVGPRASAASAEWQRNMANLSLVTNGAQASMSDFLDLNGKVADFTRGLVFLGETASELGNNKVIAGIGRLVASTLKLLSVFKELVALPFSVVSVGFDTSFALWDRVLNGALTRAAEASGKFQELADTVAGVGTEIDGAGAKLVKFAEQGPFLGEGELDSERSKRAAQEASKASAGARKTDESVQFQRAIDEGLAEFIAAQEAFAKGAFGQGIEGGGRDLSADLSIGFVGVENAVGELPGKFDGSMRQMGSAIASSFMSVAGGINGGLFGIMEALGPTGAIVSSSIQTLLNLDQIGDEILATIEQIITELPSILAETLPEFVGKFWSEGVPALIGAIPKLVGAMVIGFARFFDPTGKVKKIGEQLGIIDGKPSETFTAAGQGPLLFGGGDSRLPGFDSGIAEVNQNMLALLHPGNTVTASRDGTTSGKGQRNMRGARGSTTINISVNGGMDPAAIRSLIRQLNAAIGGRGLGENLNGFST